jgi:E3 ubiquitin-protein ligase BRE1
MFSWTISHKLPQVAKEYEMNEVLSKLKKRDGDNARLREHRDQLLAELTERKHTELVKIHSTQELKTLSESRAASQC